MTPSGTPTTTTQSQKSRRTERTLRRVAPTGGRAAHPRSVVLESGRRFKLRPEHPNLVQCRRELSEEFDRLFPVQDRNARREHRHRSQTVLDQFGDRQFHRLQR
jgi:hypothetical protein